MKRAAGRALRLLPIIAILVAAAGALAGQQRGVNDGNSPAADANGPYDPVPNWFKPLHEGKVQCASGVAAESPNRIYVVTEVEIPAGSTFLEGPAGGVGGSGGCTTERYKPNAHSHNILVVDGTGKAIEEWTQWNNLFGFGHAVRINPNDPAHVWIINRDVHQVHEFTRDGKQLVLTLGWLLRHPGTDDRHFNMPADIAFLPDGTFFVADGYENSRVVKFDKNGKYLQAWGTFGSGPSQFKVVHGVGVDAQRRVYVADRDNNRVQVFDENGKYLSEFRTFASPAHVLATKDQAVWVMTLGSHRMAKYDLAGHLLTSWGVDRPAPGDFAGGHQFSIDSAGNLYVANFRQGVMKFVPKPNADKSRLIGQPY
jgi:DNA-binding beta-propeller fold protein YncE